MRFAQFVQKQFPLSHKPSNTKNWWRLGCRCKWFAESGPREGYDCVITEIRDSKLCVVSVSGPGLISPVPNIYLNRLNHKLTGVEE